MVILITYHVSFNIINQMDGGLEISIDTADLFKYFYLDHEYSI